MSENVERSLRWRHKPFPELVRLAWPIAVSMLSYSVMTLTDTLFVGRLGASALAGVGLGGVAAFTALCFGFGLLRAVKVLASQSVGAGRPQMAGTWLSAGLAFAAVLSVLALGFGQVLARFVANLAETAAAGDAAQTYVTIRLLGTPAVMAYVALREHSYGVGDSRAPMVASVLANVVNVGLDAVFILGLGWGVAGAAWSTVVGNAVELATMAWLGRRRLRLRPVGWSHLKELWSVGLPSGLQFVLEVSAFAVLTVIISQIGELDLAAHQVALQTVHFSFLPTVALSEAASVMAGQAVGAGRLRLVRRVARIALVGALGYTGACTLVLVFGSELIARAFTDDARLIATIVGLLHVAALFQMADGAMIVARGVLRGTGDVRYPAMVAIVAAWVFTPPLAWLLGSLAGLGALGGWIGLCAEITVVMAMFWWRVERVGWLAEARKVRAQALAA